MAGISIATFNLQQESAFSGPAFTIGGASGIAPSLIFDIGNAATGPDLLRITKTVSVLATGGDITIDPLAGDTSLSASSYYPIISAGGFSGTGGNGLTLTDSTLSVAGTTYDLSVAHSSATSEVLTVSVDTPAAPALREPLAYHEDSREDQFRDTPGSAPLVTTAAVPEPTTTMSLLSAMGAAAGWLLRRSKLDDCRKKKSRVGGGR